MTTTAGSACALARRDNANAEINDIAKLAFIAGRTNRQINNKASGAYFPELIAKAGVRALLEARPGVARAERAVPG